MFAIPLAGSRMDWNVLEYYLTARANALLTAVAKMRKLVIGIEDRVREIHGAACVKTVLEPERVAEIVHRFFERALEEHVFIGALAIKFVAQTMQRNDCGALLFARVAEDELMRRLVQVVIGDDEPNVTRYAERADPRDQRIEKKLLTRTVERRARHAQRPFDAACEEKSLFDAEREALEKSRLHCVDRHDADLPHAASIRRASRSEPVQRSASRSRTMAA